MLTYQLRERNLQFQEGVNPTYPSEASVNIALQPSTQFGGVPGISSNAVTDRQAKLKLNLSTGRSEINWEKPLFEPIETSLNIGNTIFRIEANVVNVKSRCRSRQDLIDLISTVYYAYPAVLNVYLPDVPFPTHAWGTVNEYKFKWNYEPSGIPIQGMIVTSKKNQEQLAAKSWRLIAVVANNRRLMGGLHYFHVACRLQKAGYTRFEFMAEAILNFAKCLQSTFGESRDDIREEIRKLELFDEEEIEAKIIPSLILRNEFDISHVSLALLNRQQLNILHEYTYLAEGAFRKLFIGLLEKLDNNQYKLQQGGDSILSADKEIILRRMIKNIKPFIKIK